MISTQYPVYPVSVMHAVWNNLLGWNRKQRFAGLRIMVALCAAVTMPVAVGAAPLDKPVAVQGQAQQEAVHSQDKIDKLADQTSELATRYKSVLTELDNQRSYNDQLTNLVKSQEQEAQSLQRQLRDIDVTEQQILPFIQRMLATLDEFVKLDVPFLPDERRRRLAQLHAMMDDATVPIAEKYRRVMEAYQIETDYGRNIEAYSFAENLYSFR